ncbi:MAG: DNA starvation/stationary phase protection protein Dps [Dehalococcoidia bacterium]
MTTATMTPAKVDRPLNELSKSRKAEIIRNLNAALATNVDLHLVAKQAHWNIKGPNFQGLHQLFDKVAAAATEYADLVAERAVALGGMAEGTHHDVAANTALKKFPSGERRWEPLVKEVHNRVLAAADQAREFGGGLDDDIATQDIYVEIIRGLDKWAWMLEAHLG